MTLAPSSPPPHLPPTAALQPYEDTTSTADHDNSYALHVALFPTSIDGITPMLNALTAPSPTSPNAIANATAVVQFYMTNSNLHQVYFSQHCFGHVTEESFDFLGSPITVHPTAGLDLTEHDGHVIRVFAT